MKNPDTEELERDKELEARVLRPILKRMHRQRSSSEIDLDNNWLITLSDVLSLLLVFFVVFTVMARSTGAAAPKIDEPKVNSPVVVRSQDDATLFQESMIKEMNDAIIRLDLANEVFVHAVDKEIIITLKETVAFRPGEAEPLHSSEPILDNIARIIQQHPTYLVDIEGHTDNIPIRTYRYPSNWELSVARATNVLKYFIKRHDIDPSRLSVKGNADQRPLVANDTTDNRARNRRVEIRLKDRGA